MVYSYEAKGVALANKRLLVFAEKIVCLGRKDRVFVSNRPFVCPKQMM